MWPDYKFHDTREYIKPNWDNINQNELFIAIKVTGLYEETHGIVANSMYDRTLNATFDKGTLSATPSIEGEWFAQNSVTEPIWTTNQRAGHGRRSAAEWLGANVVFANETIVNIAYDHAKTGEGLVDEFMDLFTDPEMPINFGAIYFDEPGWKKLCLLRISHYLWQ